MSSKSTEPKTSSLWCSDCDNRRATQLHPYILCDSCWADRYSTQNINGKTLPYKEIIKAQLIAMDLWFKDGETRAEWHKRMEVDGRSALRRYARGKESKVGIHQEPAGDGGGGA